MSCEILNVIEFSKRLNISRATTFNWINRNILREGIHYIRLGRVLRFIWSQDMFVGLHPNTRPAHSVKAALRPNSSTKQKTINWEY